MPFEDGRDFLKCLEEEGDLLRIQDPVDVKYEIAAYIRKTSDEQGPVLLFENVKGFDMPVVGGLFGTRRRSIRALDYPTDEVFERFYEGAQHPLPPVLTDEAPCQEVVLLGEEADLRQLPIPTYSLSDGGAFITLGIQVSKDPESGLQNAGIYRMQLKGPRRLGLYASRHQHAALHVAEAEKRGEALEMAVAIGMDPAILLASQVKESLGVDEVAVAGGLRGAPVPVVQCKTVDLRVPATSEIVIEGKFIPGYREDEGPFGEFSGYYGPKTKRPVMEVTAITHRRNPIYYAGLTGVPMTDNHHLKQLPNEVTLYRELKAKFTGIKAVHYPASGCSEYVCYISMTPRYKGEPRNVLLGALGSVKRPKIAIVVDEDIDVFDEVKVHWAVATRMQPDRDLIVVPRVGSAPLDPSTPESNYSAVLGVDATRPFGEPFPEVPVVPGVEKLPSLVELMRSAKTVLGVGG